MAKEKKKGLSETLGDLARNEIGYSYPFTDLPTELSFLAQRHGKVSHIALSEFLLNSHGKVAPTTVKRTLEDFKPVVDEAQGIVLNRLLDHYKELASFLESLVLPTTELMITRFASIPDAEDPAYKELEACFEKVVFKRGDTTKTDDGETIYFYCKNPITGEEVGVFKRNLKEYGDSLEGYVFKEPRDKVLELLDRLPKDLKKFGLTMTTSDSINGLFEVAKFCNDRGISPLNDKEIYHDVGYKDGTALRWYKSASIAYQLICSMLGFIYSARVEQEKNKRDFSMPVNLQKTYKGDFIAKPPIEMTETDMATLADNPNSLATLNKAFRTAQALDAEGGLLATATDPTLFDLLPIEYQSPLKMVGILNRSYRRGFVALNRYMHTNNGVAPSVLDTLEIAKAYGGYEEIIKKYGYLPKHYKDQLLTELTLLKGQDIYYTYYDPELKKEMIGSIKIFEFDISTDGKTIKDLRFTQAYKDAVSDPKRPMLHLAIPKSLDYLDTIAQDIAYRISLYFVGKRGEPEQKKRLGKTTRGGFVEKEITEIYKGYIPAYDKNTRARAKTRTIKALDDIKTQGDILDRYELIKRGQKTFVRLYPSEYLKKAYKDKETNASLEALHSKEQEQRRADLQKLLGYVRKDLKAKKDSTEYLDYVAEDLGLPSRVELGEYLVKPDKRKKIYPKDIDDEFYANIKNLKEDYEG